MFGFDFLFFGALLALPLAGLPVLLHLLYRRKSTVHFFSTLRFIRASVQQTAARRRVQKWLLLAARVALLLFLILAAAQPARKIASNWSSSGSSIAAVVVDTSYSMKLHDDQQDLVGQANRVVTELLKSELSDSSVALFTSVASPTTETLQPSNKLATNWTPLQPTASPQPLADRIGAAMRFLDAQQASQKWLIVVSDLQNREFPRPLSEWNGGRFLVMNLRSPSARSTGIASIRLDPPQPIAGVGCDAVVKVVGRAGDSRAVTVRLTDPDNKPLAQTPPQIARLDDAGQVELRFEFTMPRQPWVIASAELNGDDDMNWDNQRALVVQTPSQRRVKLLNGSASGFATSAIQLALDPSEGKSPDWPLKIQTSASIDGDDLAIVTIWTDWPDIATAQKLRDAVQRGRTLVLFLRPGLQETWSKLSDPLKQAISPLLPGVPVTSTSSDFSRHAIAPAAGENPLRDLFDERFHLAGLMAQRVVPIDRRGESRVLLDSVLNSPGTDRPSPLLLRHSLGTGAIYTLTTLPDPKYSNLATHPIFLPMLVRSCLPDAQSSLAQNVELGATLKQTIANHTTVVVHAPGDAQFSIDRPAGQSDFVYPRPADPGMYRWTDKNSLAPLAITSVQTPSGESELSYRDPKSIFAGDQVVIASNLDELRSQITSQTQPQPRWSPLVAAVLLMMCLEAFLGNSARLWRGK